MNNSLIIDYQWKLDHLKIPLYIFNKLIQVLDKYKIDIGSKTLDSGCGGGYLLNYLTEKNYLDVWGIDISQSGIDIINKIYPHLNSKVAVHDVFEVNMPDKFPNNYDIVFSTEVIEHLYNPGFYLNNVNELLNKNGLLILSTPFHGYLKNLIIPLAGKNNSHYDPNWVGGHIKFFSKRTLEKLLLENNFQIEEFIGYGRVPAIWKSMLIVAQKA